jgi:hypothetical protein
VQLGAAQYACVKRTPRAARRSKFGVAVCLFSAEVADPVVQVIYGNEEDVGLVARRRDGGAGRDDEQRERTTRQG